MSSSPAAKRSRVIADSPHIVGERSWHDRDAELRACAVDLTDSPVQPAQAVIPPPPPPMPSVDEGDEPMVVGERSWQERDAAARAAAVDLDHSPACSSTPAVAPTVKPEPRVKPESPSTQPSAVPRPSAWHQPTPEPLAQFDPVVGLDADQRRALAVALSGRSLFLTGGAGVGKSFTLRRIVGALQHKHGVNAVAVTASTGTASVHLEPDGQTLHSMAGVGVPQVHDHFGRIWGRTGPQGQGKIDDWRDTKVLVVDEVSMLDAEFLDWLSVTVADALAEPYVPKEEKEEHRAMGYPPPPLQPFGGRIQLIFCGDFLQLPPVQKSADEAPGLRDAPTGKREGCVPYGLRECAARPAFQSVCWREANLEIVELTTIHRQRDQVLMHALNAIRTGARATREIAQLRGFTRRALPPRNGVEPTRLFPTNRQCDVVNDGRLRALPSPLTTTTSFDSVVASAESPAVAAAHGEVAKAAARAEVEEELVHDEFFSGERSGACRVPRELQLKLGAQVMLLRNEGPGGFVNGDTGVVVGFEAVEPNTEEHKQLSKDLPEALGVAWPRVRFARSTRSGREEKLLLPVKFERRVFRRGTCVRWQCPLRLSWAITIHKSQGMSLPYVVCDIGNAFAPGQVYVALSRAVSMQGMQIVNFDEQRIKVSYPALYFHRAASEASRTRDAAPLAKFWASSHFWWLPLVNTPNADPRWLELYERHTDAWQLQRWRQRYPVPTNLRSPSLAAAEAARAAAAAADAGRT